MEDVMELPQAPSRLIAESGLPDFGVYAGSIEDLSLKRFDHTSLRRGLLSKIPSLAKMYIKRWHYIGVVHKDFILGAACVNTSYLGNIFGYLYDRETKRVEKFETLAPGGAGCAIAPSPLAGKTVGKAAGMEIVADHDAAPVTVSMNFKNRLTASLRLNRTGFTPISCVTRIGLGGFNYTDKCSGLPCEGQVTLGDKTYSADGALAVTDFTVGAPARQTFWNWASGGGKLKNGSSFGINFAAGINETGFTENVFWVGGKPYHAGSIHFDYDRSDLLRPWRITSSLGNVNMTFDPEGKRSAKINILFLASAFHQPFGAFAGRVVTDKGEQEIDSVVGFTEEHYALW